MTGASAEELRTAAEQETKQNSAGDFCMNQQREGHERKGKKHRKHKILVYGTQRAAP